MTIMSHPQIKLIYSCKKYKNFSKTHIPIKVFLFSNPPPESPPDSILDWLFVGTYKHAANKKELDQLGIKYVLDVEEVYINLIFFFLKNF